MKSISAATSHDTVREPLTTAEIENGNRVRQEKMAHIVVDPPDLIPPDGQVIWILGIGIVNASTQTPGAESSGQGTMLPDTPEKLTLWLSELDLGFLNKS